MNPKTILGLWLIFLVVAIPLSTSVSALPSEATPPDTTPPEIDVTIPSIIAGNKIDMDGSTELGASVTLFIDGAQAGTTIAKTPVNDTKTKYLGLFHFPGVLLAANKETALKIEVADKSGNKNTWQGKIITDTIKPQLTLEKIPSLVASSSLTLIGTISEESIYEISVNNKSITKGEGKVINQQVSFKEGQNLLIVHVRDKAGWEVSQQFNVESDTKQPSVQFKLEKGNEYYQGSAISTIYGKTKPGATVYLYLYRPTTTEYKPQFDHALAKGTTDSNGEFTFKDVNFESSSFSLEKLAPQQVPSGLENYLITPSQAAAQQNTYHLFIVVEDKTGKTAFQQATIQINTCFAGQFNFDVEPITKFQAPLKLHPQLLDQGRETANIVFNLSYRGNAPTKRDPTTGAVIENAFEITDVRFERACTPGMLKDPSSKLGCTILPPTVKAISNTDKTSWYLTYTLQSSEKLSEKKDSYWEEFKKRQIVFPLKVRISYRERTSTATTNQWSDVKTQVSCQNLGYFVDIPLESKNYIPDIVAEEGLDTIKFTIKKIDVVLPYLEKAILTAGVGCVSGYIGRTTIRLGRIFYSKIEPLETTVTSSTSSSSSSSSGNQENKESKKEACPLDQDGLILQNTKDQWEKLETNFDAKTTPRGDWKNKKTLNELCPTTAKLWELEAKFDQLYRWSCDRVFCRPVPAKWTASKEKPEVDTVILQQQQCTATSRGIPLQKIENCQEHVTKDTTVIRSSPLAQELKRKGSFTCYRNTLNDQLYYVDPSKLSSTQSDFVTLDWLSPVGGIEIAQATQGGYDKLLAYKPKNSNDILVGTDQSCENICKNPRQPGYQSDGCYDEQRTPLSGEITLQKGTQLLTGNRYSAGYTKDCFVKTDSNKNPFPPQGTMTGLQQCVCVGSDKPTENSQGAREALKESADGSVSEEWDYRQAQINKQNPSKGTYYPEWRYYTGRDTSGAFGQNHVLDAFSEKKTIHEINPNTQHLGAFQSMCLSGIRARLVTLKGILTSLSSCIDEAKYTGFKDAGVCKTLFSQQVCGLAYKAISYLTNRCSPLTWQDQLKTTPSFEALGTGSRAFFSSVNEALQSSVDDIQSDYTNANLQQFFSGGAKGFAQSMCLAAFGYDWPLGMDFILDSAYSFPMKTTTHVLPREREFSSFNPAKGTATFNYNVGALIIPGCLITRATAYLKCVGPEDQTRPGIQCGGQGCDCLRATTISSLEGEKIRYLDGGNLFNLEPYQPISFPISAPQKIGTSYRYDHVVIELQLAKNEKPEACFDEGYQDGKFYFPLVDIPSSVTLTCQAELNSGRFLCPEIQAQFGTGGSYLEDPYITCYDKKSQSWTSCETLNLFVKGDEIKVKSHIISDGKKACLQLSTTGIGQGITIRGVRPLPENLAGSFSPEWNLGTVEPQLFSGGSSTLKSVFSESDPACSTAIQYDVIPPTSSKSAHLYRFNYNLLPGGLYRVTVPSDVTVDLPFTIENNILKKNGNEQVSSSDLLSARFILDGFKVRGLIGSPPGGKNTCTYETSASAVTNQNIQQQRSLSVTAKLLQPDINGNCYDATTLVKSPAYGKAQHTQNIVLQLQSVQTQIASGLHQNFMAGNCNAVQQTAISLINRKQADLEDALALYYSSACYILQGQQEWVSLYRNPICILSNIFFNRLYADGSIAPVYSSTLKQTNEFQKISQYMSLIAQQAGCTTAILSTSISPPSSSPSLSSPPSSVSIPSTSDNLPSEIPPPPFPSATLPITSPSIVTACGKEPVNSQFITKKPANWHAYVCRQPEPSETLGTSQIQPGGTPQCWSAGEYSTETNSDGSSKGCPNEPAELCCPAQ